MGILTSQLNNKNIEVTPRPDTDSIRIDSIQEHPDNFFEIDEHELRILADDIKENGLNSRILVRRLPEDHPLYTSERPYQALGGHRRRRATIILGWEFIDAKIRECDDLSAHEIVLTDNLTARTITAKERMRAVEYLTQIYKDKKRDGGMPGRVQDLVANVMKLSPTQVQRYDVILRKGGEKLRDAVNNEEISIKNAVEIASLDTDDQDSIIDSGFGNDSKKIKIFKDNLKQSDMPISDNIIETSIDIFETAKNEEPKSIKVSSPINDPLPGQSTIEDFMSDSIEAFEEESVDTTEEVKLEDGSDYSQSQTAKRTKNKIIDEIEDMETAIKDIETLLSELQVPDYEIVDFDLKLRITKKSIENLLETAEVLIAN